MRTSLVLFGLVACTSEFDLVPIDDGAGASPEFVAVSFEDGCVERTVRLSGDTEWTHAEFVPSKGTSPGAVILPDPATFPVAKSAFVTIVACPEARPLVGEILFHRADGKPDVVWIEEE